MNWRPASTFQAYNEPGLASHQDIGGVAMTATSTARITDLGFVSTKRAQFEFVFNHVSTFLFTSWLIAVEQYIVSVTHAARFTVTSAWRVKYTSIATHHSTSCIQNLRRHSLQEVLQHSILGI